MPKYLCRTTLRTDSGENQYTSGRFYINENPNDSGALDMAADDGRKRWINKDDVDGWFHAFELVKVEWPEPVEVCALLVSCFPNDPSAILHIQNYVFDLHGVTELHEFTGRLIEAAESENGGDNG